VVGVDAARGAIVWAINPQGPRARLEIRQPDGQVAPLLGTPEAEPPASEEVARYYAHRIALLDGGDTLLAAGGCRLDSAMQSVCVQRVVPSAPVQRIADDVRPFDSADVRLIRAGEQVLVLWAANEGDHRLLRARPMASDGLSNGSAFTLASDLRGDLDAFSDPEYDAAALADGSFAVAHSAWRQGRGWIEVRFFTREGILRGEAIVLTDGKADATHPVLAMTDGRLGVAWLEGAGRQTAIVFRAIDLASAAPTPRQLIAEGGVAMPRVVAQGDGFGVAFLRPVRRGTEVVTASLASSGSSPRLEVVQRMIPPAPRFLDLTSVSGRAVVTWAEDADGQVRVVRR
jgi:hypothetical protein